MELLLIQIVPGQLMVDLVVQDVEIFTFMIMNLVSVVVLILPIIILVLTLIILYLQQQPVIKITMELQMR